MTASRSLSLSRRALTGALGALALGVFAAPSLALAPGFAAYTPDAFDKANKSGKPVLVHVHASWCPTCVKQEKAFNELASHADFQKFVAINVNFDMDTDFRKAHNVNNQSIILVFKGGKEVARIGGETDTKKIAAFLAKSL